MKYAYIRVSSKDQHTDRQLAMMAEQGIEPENMFIDKQSGKDFDRPEYQRMIDTIKEGDVVYISSIDRLGRNYDMLIEEWNRITKIIKADIIVLDMPLLNTTNDNNNLTGKLLSDIVLQIIAYVAETERAFIRKRQAEGIREARNRGAYVNIELDEDRLRELKKAVDEKKMSAAAAARELGISRVTWYRRTADL